MKRLWRLSGVALGAAAVYAVVLVVLGAALRGVLSERVEARIAAALDAEVTVGSADVSLLWGTVEVREVAIERQRGGHLQVSIDRIHADLAPLGWMVVSREPERVSARGVAMSLSARGALDLPERPERKPVRAGSMHIEELSLVAMPTALLPELGRLELHVDQAHTGPVELRGSLDWIFAARELDVTAELPGGVRAGVRYTDGSLRVSAGIFGARPLVVPFEMPQPDADALEVEKLRVLMSALIESLGAHTAKSWLEQRVREQARELFD